MKNMKYIFVFHISVRDTAITIAEESPISKQTIKQSFIIHLIVYLYDYLRANARQGVHWQFLMTDVEVWPSKKLFFPCQNLISLVTPERFPKTWIIATPKGSYAMKTLFATPVNRTNLRYDLATRDISYYILVRY